MENCAYLRKNPGYAPAIARNNVLLICVVFAIRSLWKVVSINVGNRPEKKKKTKTNKQAKTKNYWKI